MFAFIKKIFLKLIVLILVAIFAVICVFFPHKLKSLYNVVNSYYDVYEGDKAYKNQNLLSAIAYYKEALAIYPAHVKARYNLGNIYIAYEDYDSAISCYETALKYDPNFMNARINYGILLSEKYLDFDAAINQYQKVIDNAPLFINIPMIYNNKEFVTYNKAVAYHNMGIAYKWKSLASGDNQALERENLLKAEDAYRNSLEIFHSSYETMFNLALVLQLLGKLDEAKKVYCLCIHDRPFDYDAHYNLAILLGQQKKYLDSVLELQKAALIIDSVGDGYKTRYIYDVIQESSKILQTEDDYKNIREELDDSPINDFKMTYVNGKVIVEEKLDKAIVDNMKTCSACSGYKIKKAKKDKPKETPDVENDAID